VEEDSGIQFQIILALERLGVRYDSPRIANFIPSLLASENSCVIWAAAEQYGQQAITPLTALLDDPDAMVRTSASNMLRRLEQQLLPE